MSPLSIQILTGVPTCLRFVRLRGVEGKRPGPFVVGAVACAAWAEYGLAAGDGPVWRVNAAGTALYVAYASCYARYAGPAARRGLAKVSAALIAWFVLFLFYLFRLSESE